MNVFVYENERVENLYPFSVLHASWEILCGTKQNWERIKYWFGKISQFYGRDNITDSFIGRFDLKTSISHDSKSYSIYFDGSLCLDKSAANTIKDNLTDDICKVFTINSHVVAIYTNQYFESRDELLSYKPTDYKIIELQDISCGLFEYNYEPIFRNGKQIIADFIEFELNDDNSNNPDYTKVGDKGLSIGNNVKIGHGVVLDCTEGPIIISDNVVIEHNCTIYGPSYIGNKTKVRTNAVIEPDCSFGPVCKIGGEIENTIVHGYSNKQHAGFLGHSYVCEWVNLGANTDNSDLKNTYGNISLSIRGNDIDTQKTFMGSLIGDHSKTAINTQLNTGTVMGIHSMIAMSGFPPTDIRSYNWTGSKKKIIYKLSKAVETARIVMARRDKEINSSEEQLMKNEFEKVKPYYYDK